ncbi:MAG: hypothetical protein OHK0013_19420 [Sandaracinaceae bacterium]
MRQLLPSLSWTSPRALARSLGGVVALATGCGGTPAPEPIDATFPDAAIVFPDASATDPCDAPTRVTGTLGTPTEVMLDTTMTDERPRDLGLACGNVTARRWARQEVIEYTVPGTGPVGVSISTANMGTDTRFNTVLQIRRSCTQVPTATFPPSCFDDAGMEIRASGGIQAMGGDTIFIYVTGYSEPDAVTMQQDEGRVRVTITAAPNAPPTLTTGSFRLIQNDSRIEAQGTDADGNILGVTLGLFNASGRLDFNGDGVGNELDVFDFRFAEVTGTTDWSGRVDISGMELRFAEVCRSPMVRCTEAVLVAYDSAYASSAPLRVPVRDATVVGFGDTCDGLETVCAAGLVCNAMTCEPTPAALAACMGATPIVVPEPMGTATSGSATATIPAGMSGTFLAPTGCAPGMGGDPTSGPERVFSVAVPAGTYDLTFATNRPGTGTTDTVLYVRGECGDPTDDLGCQDDIARGMLGSTVTVMNATEGDYFAIVETYGGGGGPVEIQATLKPVLATGEACDPAGVANRCAMGVCNATTMVCP